MEVREYIENELLVFLPAQTVERLAPILTEDDVATLKFLYVEAIPENTLRAMASDLGYLERWHLAATGRPLDWPASEEAVLKFIAHHLFNEEEHERNPQHGMPDEIADCLIEAGACQMRPPHAPSTVRRRLSHWKRLHVVKDLDHVFDQDPIRAAAKSAVKASPRVKTQKSKKPITLEVLNAAVKTCDPYTARGRRDRAILLIAFGSGGRRRSEVADLWIDDIQPVVPSLKRGEPRPAPVDVYDIGLRRAKRIRADDGERIHVTGRPARALEEWVWVLRRECGEDVSGPLFRRIRRYGEIGRHAIAPSTVNDILKAHIRAAGLDPDDYSAHGIRSGFLTEARNAGVPLEEAMAHTKHRSYQVASSYYRHEDKKRSRAIKIAG